MTKTQDEEGADLPIENLQLTVRATRVLRDHGIRTIGELVAKTEDDLVAIGLAAQNRLEIRDVLASRGI